MAEVQPQRPSKKKAGNLDGFLACGGKVETSKGTSPRPSSSKPKADAADILNACEDANIEALLNIVKSDKLPVARSKSATANAARNSLTLSQSAHVKTGAAAAAAKNPHERRLSDTRKKGISRAQSFDKNTAMKRMSMNASSSNAMTNTASAADADAGASASAGTVEKPKKPKPAAMIRSKSYESDMMPLKRIPRGVARGEPEREAPVRAKSMNDKQVMKREKHASQSTKKSNQEKETTKKSTPNHDKEKEGTTKKTTSNHDKEKGTKEKSKRHSRSSKPEAKRDSKSKSPTPRQQQQPKSPSKHSKKTDAAEFTKQLLHEPSTEDLFGDNHTNAAFEATFGGPSNHSSSDHDIDDDSNSNSDDDDEEFEASGIMQFDPTAADNVVVVRQDSGAFPSCPVEMDLPSISDLDYNQQPQSNSQQQLPSQEEQEDNNTNTLWGKKSTFGGMSLFGGGKNKLKKSNSFKFGSTAAAADNDDMEPTTPTSIFSTLFSSNNQHVGHEQLGDDETMDDSYLHGASR